jgi:MiaB-like tRNA modifying enzyme
VRSFGCSTNFADGEVLAGCLAAAGFKLTDSVSAADLIICNTCAVKGPTENRILNLLKRIPPNKKLIIAGCLPQINFERLQSEVRFDGVVGPAFGDKIVEVVRQVLNGERVVALQSFIDAKPSLKLPRSQRNPTISIIPVNYGCLGACAYCCVVFARGHLRSYDKQQIVERMHTDLANNVREFWITSQDTACYGRDIQTNLAELLKSICKIRGDYRIRVGMMTPNMVTDIQDNLVQAFKNDKIFKFIHLPVQSGDDKTLERMRRFYTTEDFKNVVKNFQTRIPHLTLATDVICGFPGESKQSFENTLHLIEEIEPDIVNVSKFFARPKTLAAEMENDFVPFNEIKERSSVMAKLAKQIGFEKNQDWLGWTGDILIDEVGKVPGSWIGRNFAYKPVVMKSGDYLLGKTVSVEIVKAFSTHLEGEVV